MQKQLETLLNKLADILMVVLRQVGTAMQWVYQWLRRGYDWYQSVDWPEIPLSPLQWVLVLYVMFGLVYLWATPIFEASDELWHFGMVEYIRENGDLPVQNPDPNAPVTAWRQEGSQPPLYYAAMALLTSPVDIRDADAYRELNPHAQTGNPGSYGNKNIVLHSVDGVPLAGTPLAVYLIRLVGIAIGCVTIWAVYNAGRLVAPHRSVVGIVAAALTAFNPMFIFISASVNNDVLVIALNSIAVWLMLLTLKEGFEWKRSLAIAVLVALASLTKLSALVLVPPIALGGLWVARRDDDWRGVFILGGAMLGIWLAVSGWWYLRNVTLYGELFGTATMTAVANRGTERVFDLGTLISEFQGFRMSYWGIFGAFTIQTSAVFYALTDLLVFTSIFGVMFLVAQLIAIRDFSYARRELTYLLFLLGIVLVGIIAFVSWTAQTYASQGRLLFPFMAAISPLLAVGFVEVMWWILFLLSPPDRSFVRAGEAVPEYTLRQGLRYPLYFLGIMAFLIPLTSIAPQYVSPAPIAAADIPETVEPVYANYGDVALIGYEHVDRRYFPGETVQMTFYWEVLEQSEDDYSLGLVLLNDTGVRLGGIDTFPGAGTLQTTEWEAGQIYADTYEIDLTRRVEGRFPFAVQVVWYDRDAQERLSVVDAADSQLETVLLNAGAYITPSLVAQPAGGDFILLMTDEYPEVTRNFDGRFALRSFATSDDPLTVSVRWDAQNTDGTDYTTFLHIVNEDGELVAQDDVFPRLPTRYWRYGEVYTIDHRIDIEDGLEPGAYSAQVGWYENLGDSFPRLPLQANPDDPESDEFPTSFELMTFEVEDDGTLILPEPEVDESDLSNPPAVPEPEIETEEATPEPEAANSE